MATQQPVLPRAVFGFLSPEQLAALESTSSTTSFQDEEVIYSRGTPATFLYVVLEGEVALRLPGSEGVSVLIEQLGPGEMFGLNATFDLGVYGLTVQSVGHSKIMRIQTSVLQRLMDQDATVGYAIQKRVSELYYRRFVAAARRLQAIMQAIPLESARQRKSRWQVE
jgi:CRP-like cAMP-binding protein